VSKYLITFLYGHLCSCFEKLMTYCNNNNINNLVTWPNGLVPSLWIERPHVQTRSKTKISAAGYAREGEGGLLQTGWPTPTNMESTDINETMPAQTSPGSTRSVAPSGCSGDKSATGGNPTIKRRKWTRQEAKEVKTYYFLSDPTTRGHRKRMRRIWKQRNPIGTSQNNHYWTKSES